MPLCVSFRSSTEKVLNNNIRSILCDRVLYSRHQSVLQSSDLTRRNLLWITIKGLKAQRWTLSNTIIAIILFCFLNFIFYSGMLLTGKNKPSITKWLEKKEHFICSCTLDGVLETITHNKEKRRKEKEISLKVNRYDTIITYREEKWRHQKKLNWKNDWWKLVGRNSIVLLWWFV